MQAFLDRLDIRVVHFRFSYVHERRPLSFFNLELWLGIQRIHHDSGTRLRIRIAVHNKVYDTHIECD